ncbi:hypothetical protein DSO57_1038172 [Entomophthora muscae]|uniref:Uncharacterized protein n=1 Tax=Entomophthora muscae TaxID=34485 RepID=A0ACC2TXI7_9FUNG|nr:hypothetical protein DSO57_1038172 [Entomophthora muscae]
MAGKALSYLVKLVPIIWWVMPVPASAPPSPEGASQYSWYPDRWLAAWVNDQKLARLMAVMMELLSFDFPEMRSAMLRYHAMNSDK